MNKNILITGANRGIGKETARQLAELNCNVILTARDLSKAQKTANEINQNVIALQLDVTSEESCKTAVEVLNDNFDRIDVLINNAGIMGRSPVLDFNINEIYSVLETNFYGAVRITRHLMPLLRKSDDARIINISSRMGEISSLQSGGHAAYKLSKLMLNGFTMLLANELKNSKVTVNSMCPGWVRTDMGGPNAHRTVEKGAETAVWLATTKKIPSGKFFADMKEIDW